MVSHLVLLVFTSKHTDMFHRGKEGLKAYCNAHVLHTYKSK